MKRYKVVEALIPIANDIYDKESLDIIDINNLSNRVIAAPGEFTLGEELSESDFEYANRTYENEDGSNSVSGVFAVRRKEKEYSLLVTIHVKVKTDLSNIQDVIDEFSTECDYTLSSTDNIQVISTEWMDIQRTF